MVVALEGALVLIAPFTIGLLLYLWLELSCYVSYKKKMLADGHTKVCSRKIAFEGMLKSSMYYPFKIMN